MLISLGIAAMKQYTAMNEQYTAMEVTASDIYALVARLSACSRPKPVDHGC